VPYAIAYLLIWSSGHLVIWSSGHLVIVSDDAGQFNLLLHALCWIHTERLIHKMLPLNETHRQEIAQIRSQM
jgi:hypothetical protein